MNPAIMLFQLLIMAGVPIVALGFFGWLALRYVRTRERDSTSRIESGSEREIAKLAEVVTALQADVHALRERQEFVEKLLEAPRPRPDAR